MLPADPTVSVAERVDAACDHFEAEWKAGSRPRIDDYLAAAPESDREELGPALLALELELQGRSEADTSVSRSSVRSGGQPTPMMTVDHVQHSEPSASTVGRFAIRGVLGSGAFGKVYRAFDPQLGREVAVKVPLASTVQTEKERAQFLKEARSAANINHPNVCQVHEVGEADGRPYIVMTLVRGQSLAETLKTRKEPLPEKQTALVIRKIALALAAAHDSGIVHRDLKPANVMFDRERKDIVVMDFGLARGPKLGDARGTQSGVIMGTPAYMSPEQARGDTKGVGPAGDIFSLGVVLYELLTGARPFTGTATEVIGQILHVDPEPPSRHRPGIDPRLEAACLKAMAKNPAARFATMKEFAAAIDAVLRAPAPAGPAVETAKANTTRREGDDQSTNTSNNLAEVFAALSDDRKQARAETAAVVEAALAKHRTPRWVFLLVGLLFAGGFAALAGVIFFTRSDKVKVDLAVIINDVDLKDNSLSFFLDDEPVAADALAEPVELKPGVHTFTVKRGKEIVKRVEIRVEGGKKPRIKVEVIPPKVEPPPPEPPKKPAVVWRSLMPTPEYLATEAASNHGIGDKVVKLNNGALELHGAGAAFRPDFAGGKNYIVRAKVLSFSGNNMVFRSRSRPGEPHYGAYFHEPRPGVDLPSCGLARQVPGAWQDLVGTKKSVVDTLPVEFALSCFGDRIAIYMNGEKMVECQDGVATEGKFHITLTQDSHVALRDLEVCLLDGTRLTPDDVFPPNPDAEGRRALAPAFLTDELRKGNLLKNGDFEADGLVDWKFDGWRNNPAVGRLTGTTKRSGKQALQYTFAETDSAWFAQQVAVRKWRMYLLSGWIKTEGLRFAERSRAGARLDVPGVYRQKTDFLPEGDNDWTYFAIVFRSGNRDVVEAHVRFGDQSGTCTGTAWFDDLCLIELPDPLPPPEKKAAKDGFTSLFNGKDLTGWKPVGEPKWSWADDRLLGSPAPDKAVGFLVTEAEYQDFELELQYRFAAGAGSGLFLRADASGPATGKGQFELQLIDDDAFPQSVAINKTGAIWNIFPRKTDPPIKRNDWNTVRVRLVKRRIEVWINETQTIDANLDDARDKAATVPGLTREKGGIGLQQNQQANVEFRNVRIKALGKE